MTQPEEKSTQNENFSFSKNYFSSLSEEEQEKLIRQEIEKIEKKKGPTEEGREMFD